MTGWLYIFLPLLAAFVAGRYIEAGWMRWSVTVIAVLGPVLAQGAALWEMLTDNDGYGLVFVTFLLLLTLGQLGVAALLCVFGRWQRLRCLI